MGRISSNTDVTKGKGSKGAHTGMHADAGAHPLNRWAKRSLSLMLSRSGAGGMTLGGALRFLLASISCSSARVSGPKALFTGLVVLEGMLLLVACVAYDWCLMHECHLRWHMHSQSCSLLDALQLLHLQTLFAGPMGPRRVRKSTIYSF